MEMRLNKYLSEAGVCSRREADRLVEAGRVTIDGRRADLGDKVLEGETVAVDGRTVTLQARKVILAVNKPTGVVCTTSDRDRAPNIVELVQYPVRVYPVGRLDKDSEGLILMTNDGELMDELLRSRNGHEKEYIVEINRAVTAEWVGQMSSGVPILDTVTKPCQVEKIGYNKARIILTQGLNRQIRRMCEACDSRVISLKRVRIVNIKLGNLAPGAWRELTPEEERELRSQLRVSPKDPSSEISRSGKRTDPGRKHDGRKKADPDKKHDDRKKADPDKKPKQGKRPDSDKRFDRNQKRDQRKRPDASKTPDQNKRQAPRKGTNPIKASDPIMEQQIRAEQRLAERRLEAMRAEKRGK